MARADADVLRARLPHEVAVALSEFRGRKRAPRGATRARRAKRRSFRSATSTLLEALPGALEVCEKERVRVLFNACLERRPPTRTADHAHWRKGAEALCTVAHAVRPANVSGASTAETRFVVALESLERALRFDEVAEHLLAEWRELGASAERAGVSVGAWVEYRALISRIAHLATTVGLPRELPAEFAEALEQSGRNDADVFGCIAAAADVSACLRDRVVLLADARGGEQALTDLEAYPQWRNRAQAALARAGRFVRPQPAYLLNEGAVDPGWEKLVESAGALGQALERDALAQTLVGHWWGFERRSAVEGIEALYLEGYPVLHHRIETCCAEVADPSEIPPHLHAALRVHETMVADRDTVLETLRILKEFLDEAEELAGDEAVYGRRPADAPRYLQWLEEGEKALERGRVFLADENRYVGHLDAVPGGFDRFMRMGSRIMRTVATCRQGGTLVVR